MDDEDFKKSTRNTLSTIDGKINSILDILMEHAQRLSCLESAGTVIKIFIGFIITVIFGVAGILIALLKK